MNSVASSGTEPAHLVLNSPGTKINYLKGHIETSEYATIMARVSKISNPTFQPLPT
jgi:hypothetical protein